MAIEIRKLLSLCLIALAPCWGSPALILAAESGQGSSKDRKALLAQHRVDAIPVKLAADQTLQGIVRDNEGKPAAKTPVVLGVHGKPIAKVMSDEGGRFRFGPLKPGEYQIATKDAAAMLAVYSLKDKTKAEPKLEVSKAAMIARGQSPSSILSNPWFVGLTVAAAIAIPAAIVLSDDDDDNS